MKEPNIFSGGGFDRAGLLRKDSDWIAQLRADPGTRLIPVWRDRHLIEIAPQPEPVFLAPHEFPAPGGETEIAALLGLIDKKAFFAIDISHMDEPLDRPELAGRGEFIDIRDVGSLLTPADAQLMAYSRALFYWHRRHLYCGICGAATEMGEAGHVRICTNADCATTHFPRTDPAVIMLVIDGDRCLLGRRPGRQNFMYSTLAGFVEPGESLEEAVAREVMEETGISITNVRYAHSQPWPFPANLMLGYYADATSTEITFNDDELADANWFTRDEVRELMAVRDRSESERLGGALHLPRPVSIARRLISEWLEGLAP
ncbi:MAG: NAD(+) diphosphatase [Alphaproteobacteria bacterium]|nr:NAD(+) diphosphatase [Alphaproteobacteria bacterium]